MALTIREVSYQAAFSPILPQRRARNRMLSAHGRHFTETTDGAQITAAAVVSQVEFSVRAFQGRPIQIVLVKWPFGSCN
jgi:hypothetical protein